MWRWGSDGIEDVDLCRAHAPGDEVSFIWEVASIFRRHEKPERNAAFLKWLKRFPCFACGESRKPREAMHMGAHGIGTKSSDMDALPGCRACHREYHASVRRFYLKIGYDHVANMQAYFRNLWAWEQAGRPAAMGNMEKMENSDHLRDVTKKVDEKRAA